MQPMYQSEHLNATLRNSIRSNADNGASIIGTAGITVYKIRWAWICIPFIGVNEAYITSFKSTRHTNDKPKLRPYYTPRFLS